MRRIQELCRTWFEDSLALSPALKHISQFWQLHRRASNHLILKVRARTIFAAPATTPPPNRGVCCFTRFQVFYTRLHNGELFQMVVRLAPMDVLVRDITFCLFNPMSSYCFYYVLLGLSCLAETC